MQREPLLAYSKRLVLDQGSHARLRTKRTSLSTERNKCAFAFSCEDRIIYFKMEFKEMHRYVI